jgi:hypothetical protein
VANAPVEDVRFRNALTQCIDAAFNLGNHAFVNHSTCDELLRLCGIQRRNNLAILILDAFDITKKDELLGL